MNITVVGGGFGGVKTALRLSKNKKNKITLITDKPDFQYYPALYGTATGKSHLQSWVPLTQIFNGRSNVTIVIDSIISIDPERKLLIGKTSTYEYHTCVMALGVITTFFGIKGLDEYSYSIKSEAEIERFKAHVHKDLATTHHLDKHYVIVGAGPTGTELAGALNAYIKRLQIFYGISKERQIHIDLIEASPRVLGKLSEWASKKAEKRLKKLGVTVKTGMAVQSEGPTDITVSGKPIASNTVVWTSGVTNHPFFKEHEHYFKLAPNGRVIVDDHLMAYKDVYVIGDNAATTYTGLAQTALHDAKFVSTIITNKAKHKPLKSYKAVLPPTVVPIGENWALFEWHKIKVSGWIASLIRSAADFMGYSDILPIGQALGVWRAERVLEDESRFDTRIK